MVFPIRLTTHRHAFDRCEKNSELLKKIITAVEFGHLQINGQPPERRALGDYFDKENFIFDTTGLSDLKREQFLQWIYHEHLADSREAILSKVKLKERRGISLEVYLSWWGRFKSWLFSRKAQYWSFNHPDLSFDHQVLGAEMSLGDYGLLLSFNQLLPPNSLDRYQDPRLNHQEVIGNTKRVILTDHAVNCMLQQSLDSVDIESILAEPHPLSDAFYDRERRYQDMREYRDAHLLEAPESWYVSFYKWCKHFFVKNQPKKWIKPPKNPSLVFETNTIKVFEHDNDSRLRVMEIAPERDIIIFCGGGSKIYAHIGVLKALEARRIRPKDYIGTSAGAIMALACYLGYNSDEIIEFFKDFKQEHLVFYQPDFQGLSDNHGLKNAIQWLMLNKLTQLQARHQFTIPERITFRFLKSLKEKYPDCGLGDSLLVTATNKTKRVVEYASVIHTPDAEVVDEVAKSANMPGLYRDIIENGEHKTDGGGLSNTPIRALKQNARKTTFLSSESDPSVVIVQFDNGPEKQSIASSVKKIPRENFLVNLVYRMIIGVNDPVRDWMRDRADLRRQAANVILIDVGSISSFQFEVPEEKQNFLINQGLKAANHFIEIHFPLEEDELMGRELIYQNFSSWNELLSHCAVNGHQDLFDQLRNHISQSKLPNKNMLMKRALKLSNMYFADVKEVETTQQPSWLMFITKSDEISYKHRVFVLLFSLLKRVPEHVFHDKAGRIKFKEARQALQVDDLNPIYQRLLEIKGSVHVFIHLLRLILKQAIDNTDMEIIELLERTKELLAEPSRFKGSEFYFEPMPDESANAFIDRMIVLKTNPPRFERAKSSVLVATVPYVYEGRLKP